MPDGRWAEMIRGERPDVLATHPGAAVFDFPTARGRKDEDEDDEECDDELFHVAPIEPKAVPTEAIEEERQLFVQDVDKSTGKLVYTAGRTLMGRNAAHTIFMLPTGRKGLPWAFLIMWDGTDTLITLYWPSARVEVRGQHLATLDPLIAMQRISIWRVFEMAEHVEPKGGEPIIRAITFTPMATK